MSRPDHLFVVWQIPGTKRYCTMMTVCNLGLVQIAS